ncbi:alpha/beta hydrolase [Gordonia sp. CPCC 206044]|uniref:alpha/beta fold hydrolase n=1 Tax=Gordonia sp. CPCC 206044 TaxID=3140793 RepID=UPI003AF3EA5B
MTTLRLYHETSGTGPRTPLLLVHGGAGSIATDWGQVIPAFDVDRQVIGVELQGHGHTPHADRAYTFENSADDIAAIVGELGVPSVDIMAFSNGGPTALRFASRHPGLTRRVVVASGFVRRDGMVDGFWDGFGDATPDSVPTPLSEAYRAINPDPADLRRMFELDVDLMRGFTDWSDDELVTLEAPMLFVSGDADVVRPEHTIEMARLVPRGQALVLPAGHGDYLGAGPDGGVDAALVNASLSLIRRFLDD